MVIFVFSDFCCLAIGIAPLRSCKERRARTHHGVGAE
jgi:hypothetical protein